jgi:hypothetical protein
MSLSDVDAPSSHPPTVYDLIANVIHESVAGTTRDKENTVWKVQLRAAGGGGDSEKWFQIQDLIVEETRKEMIFLGETALQVGAHPVIAGSRSKRLIIPADLGAEVRCGGCQPYGRWQSVIVAYYHGIFVYSRVCSGW